MWMSGGSVDRPLCDLLRGVQRLATQGADEGSEITMPAQARPRSRPAHALCASTASGRQSNYGPQAAAGQTHRRREPGGSLSATFSSRKFTERPLSDLPPRDRRNPGEDGTLPGSSAATPSPRSISSCATARPCAAARARRRRGRGDRRDDAGICPSALPPVCPARLPARRRSVRGPLDPNAFLPHRYAAQRACGIRVRGLYSTKDTFVTTALDAGVTIAWLEQQT